MDRIDRGWAEDTAPLMAALETTPEGLAQDDAARRLAEHGPNALPEGRRVGPLRRLARQFNNLLILVLIVAAAITGALQHWVDTAVILAVVMINAVIGFVQEGKAEAALEALRDMLAPRAAVLRDGARTEVAAQDLVPGDVVLLEAGDKVPADLRLIEVASLSVEEAILTGESVPVRKATAAVAPDADLGDRTSVVFSGTLVAEGTAAGVVIATGADTEIGRISGMMAAVESLTTPLIRQMHVFAKWLTGFIMIVAALILAFTILVRGTPFAEAFMVIVAIFVAAIPEGLPAVLTVTLAIGVQSMARRNAIIRRLPAIETLGAVSVICSDKTGTLTRNEMMVATLATAGGRATVTGEGYAPEGALDGEVPAPILMALGRVAALCNTASLARGDGGWRTQGDPMEGALLALAGKLDQPWRDRPKPRATLPFDSRYRYMAVLQQADGGQQADGDAVILLKGAPEAVLARCDRQMTADGTAPLDADWWSEQADAIAAEGQRVLALAHKPATGTTLEHGDVEGGLVLIGLTGLIDPPRAEAITAVADCLSAGIDVKMITGDHKGTARAIARQIGLANTDDALTGAEIERMDDAELRHAALRTDVFARTSPEHKLRLVTALQARGQVVAMTGDGVNDAPALKRADAGIAMGRKGSEAAREASELVLADDNFASIAEAVRQGRTVYANLKKVIAFLLPVNGGESAALIIAVMFGLLLPVTPLQVLWVNMVSSVALAMSLAFEPPERDVMQRPPRRADGPILSRFILWRVLVVSTLFAAGIYGQFALATAQGADVDTARTMAINTLVAMEVFYLFSIRYRHASTLTWAGVRGTPAVWIAVGVVVVLQAAFTYLPPMQALFATTPLSPLQLAQCAAAGVLVLALLELDKLAARARKARNGARSRQEKHA
ncbi:cation-translocating P-type ATPase [Rhodobaculum claviforme]|uniref:Carbonate dehydratase n=1 Tax=Rhodobaculum claviforme TaxID=1549854 RepID=A0A934TIT8_9RHOB|nr:HAD-IC family P-type ATPase [Rhodobaculum claviforme]MBK5926393.1 carbonate dehydratase [Rhodobaculum claviforme]